MSHGGKVSGRGACAPVAYESTRDVAGGGAPIDRCNGSQRPTRSPGLMGGTAPCGAPALSDPRMRRTGSRPGRRPDLPLPLGEGWG